MRLYKVDTQAWTVRAVEGDPWPGSDSDGEQCWENTHFEAEADAWERLEAEALAWVEIEARDVVRARKNLAEKEKGAADASIALELVRAQRRQSPDRTGGTLYSPLIGE